MAGILSLGTPAPALAGAGVKWTNNEHWWTGWTGDTFDLSGGAEGVSLQAGVRGENMPPIQRYPRKSPAVAGSFYGGSIPDEREVFWPILVRSGGGSEDWVSRDRAFWRTMDPDQPGTWTVVQPSGEKRSLSLRFVDDGSQTFDIDPVLVGNGLYGITLVAEQPYWQGETITQSYGQGSPAEFFSGEIITISSGSTLATASISNPGDVPTYPVWTIFGPSTSVTVGVAGRTITVPITLTGGQWVRIDTRPTDSRALQGSGDVVPGAGTNVTKQLDSGTRFAEVPVGDPIPLAITMSGTGSVQMELTPLYRRAW